MTGQGCGGLRGGRDGGGRTHSHGDGVPVHVDDASQTQRLCSAASRVASATDGCSHALPCHALPAPPSPVPWHRPGGSTIGDSTAVCDRNALLMCAPPPPLPGSTLKGLQVGMHVSAISEKGMSMFSLTSSLGCYVRPEDEEYCSSIIALPKTVVLNPSRTKRTTETALQTTHAKHFDFALLH